MSDILQEVDEALKQDKILEIWKSYGNYIIAAIVMVVLMTAAKSGYEYHHKTTSEAATTALTAILEGDEENRTAELQKFIQDTKGGATIVAQLELAGSYLNDNNSAEALKTFADIAMNSKAKPYFKDFAKLMMVQIKMDDLTDENMSEVKVYLDTLINDEKSLWRHHALLNRAALHASQQDYKAAVEDAAKVKTAPNVPQSLIQRAVSLEQLYTIKLAKSDS